MNLRLLLLGREVLDIWIGRDPQIDNTAEQEDPTQYNTNYGFELENETSV